MKSIPQKCNDIQLEAILRQWRAAFGERWYGGEYSWAQRVCGICRRFDVAPPVLIARLKKKSATNPASLLVWLVKHDPAALERENAELPFWAWEDGLVGQIPEVQRISAEIGKLAAQIGRQI